MNELRKQSLVDLIDPEQLIQDLPPCPRCHSRELEFSEQDMDDGSVTYCVQCTKCGLDGDPGSIGEAFASWKELVKTVEELSRQARKLEGRE